MLSAFVWFHCRLARPGRSEEGGFVTAENLGVAALGIVALVAIFAALQAFGLDVISWIRNQTGIPAGG